MEESPAGPSFGDMLAELRRAAGFSRAALAERAELTARSIRNLESGVHQPYAQTIQRLVDALGLSAADRARLERAGRPVVRRPQAPPRPAPSADASAVATDPGPAHNLPVQLTSFVGREQERADLHTLLASTRLVTLTGAGGIGKTRLACEVAAGNVGVYPDGVWLVGLAGVSDPGLVPEAVGATLVRHEQGRRGALEWLADALRTRRLLLVLDNCEHLVAACAALADHVLRACPGVRILATSREPLGVEGEQVWRVPPLSVPNGQPSLARLRHEPAVQLFVERARSASARFDLANENAEAVVEICRRLDGVPLAIELAASRITMLTPGEIVARLGDRFRLLTTAGRTAPARHQTLRAVVDWSYDLASEPCRRLFERLAPFAGGFTLDAAEAVAGAGMSARPMGPPRSGQGAGRGGPGDRTPATTGTPDPDTFEVLADLVNQSLVHAEPERGGTRYRLLETLRAYAAERLAARGEAEAIHRRHAEHFVALAEAADLGLRGPEQAHWAARLAREYDNIQAALRWTTEHGEAELAYRMVGALWTYWYTRPRGAEGARWYARVLALDSEAVPPTVQGRALVGATGHALMEGDLVLARERAQASLALQQTLGESLEHAQTLLHHGMLKGSVGDRQSAGALMQESLAMYRRLGVRRGEGWTLAIMGQGASMAGDFERATMLLAASSQILRAIGDAYGLAITLIRAGDLASRQGDLTAARAHYEESLAQAQAAGVPRGPGILLHNLACVLGEQGELERATLLFLDALELFRGRADEAGVRRCLLGLADLALATQEPHLAARLLGAADRLQDNAARGMLPGQWTWTGGRRPYEEQIGAARDELGDLDFAAAFAEGQALTADEAADEVRHRPERHPHLPMPSGPMPSCDAVGGAGTVLNLQARLARRPTERQTSRALGHD